jgi:hypothetical protein
MCCFCGGGVKAITQDHIPPRGVFLEKKWPEQYVFPACEPCNNGSAADDSLIAFLSRMNMDMLEGTVEAREWAKLLAALRENHPGLTGEMILSANEIRRWMEKRKLAKPQGKAYGEMPMIRIPERIVQAVGRFNRKLLRALHYKHTGRIVPLDAWTMLKWWTNANLIASEFPREIADIMPGRVTLQRSNLSLGDQFNYVFGTDDKGTMGAYLAGFRRSFAVAGFVVFDAALMEDFDEQAAEKVVEGAVAAIT